MFSLSDRLRFGNTVRLYNVKSLGFILLVVGLLMFTATISYRVYSAYAGSQLDLMEATIQGPLSLPTEALIAGFLPVHFSSVFVEVELMETVNSGGRNISAHDSLESPTLGRYSANTSSYEPSTKAEQIPALDVYYSIYPGYQMHPKYWHQPLWAGTDPYLHGDKGLPDGYRPAIISDKDVSIAKTAPARKIKIPLIQVESRVKELEIVNLGDSRAYETPKNIVGHIPGTPNPGEMGNAWFFGHLESPIKGEGSVFRRLPDISEYLKNGDPVYVNIESDDGEYLYQVVSTRVVHKDDLKIYGSDNAVVTLVACVPTLVYDHRILVTGNLVGIKN